MIKGLSASGGSPLVRLDLGVGYWIFRCQVREPLLRQSLYEDLDPRTGYSPDNKSSCTLSMISLSCLDTPVFPEE